MIAAKTRMQKIPEKCNKCTLSYSNLYGRMCRIENRFCPLKQSDHGNWQYTRPDWCPLLELPSNDSPVADAEFKKVKAELEKVKEERDTALKYLNGSLYTKGDSDYD